MNNPLKCAKCGEEESEKNKLELSHDIPKWVGGTDSDGRHYLCKKCHDKYEWEVIKQAFMNLIKKLPESWKETCKFSAKIVKGYFFKEKKNV